MRDFVKLLKIGDWYTKAMVKWVNFMVCKLCLSKNYKKYNSLRKFYADNPVGCTRRLMDKPGNVHVCLKFVN